MRGSSPFAADFFAIKTLKYMRMNTINNDENQGLLCPTSGVGKALASLTGGRRIESSEGGFA